MTESTNADAYPAPNPVYFEIGQGTDVLNGFYSGINGDETIIIDYDRRSAYYDVFADSVMQTAIEREKTDYGNVLTYVCDLVGNTIHYSEEGLLHVNAFYGIDERASTSLSTYIDEGVGVSRHQALLTATIIEILRRRGVVTGVASVERNKYWKENGENGGHVWAQYTDSDGSVLILDVAKNFIGTLDESQERGYGK
jgi:hypothetical protein